MCCVFFFKQTNKKPKTSNTVLSSLRKQSNSSRGPHSLPGPQRPDPSSQLPSLHHAQSSLHNDRHSCPSRANTKELRSIQSKSMRSESGFKPSSARQWCLSLRAEPCVDLVGLAVLHAPHRSHAGLGLTELLDGGQPKAPAGEVISEGCRGTFGVDGGKAFGFGVLTRKVHQQDE